MSNVQSVLVPKSSFSREQADKWIQDHKYVVAYGNKEGPHETEKHYRYRQQDPDKYKTFRIKRLPDKIELVLGYE